MVKKQKVSNSACEEHLGAFERNLTFQSHIDSICKKAALKNKKRLAVMLFSQHSLFTAH